MSGQLSFASVEFAAKKTRTKREVFVAEMATVVPWAMLEAVIEPHYPRSARKAGTGPLHSRRCCEFNAFSNDT